MTQTPDSSSTARQEIATVRIRAAKPADSEFILGLRGRLAAASMLPWRAPVLLAAFTEAGLREAAFLDMNTTAAVLVAFRDDDALERPLGVVHVRNDRSVLTGESQGYVSILAVAGEAEGRGIGRALMVAAEAWARTRGHRLLALDTFATNKRARRLHPLGLRRGDREARQGVGWVHLNRGGIGKIGFVTRCWLTLLVNFADTDKSLRSAAPRCMAQVRKVRENEAASA